MVKLKAIRPAWQRSHFVDDFPDGQRQAPRRKARLRVSLNFSAPPRSVDGLESGQEFPKIIGETRNVSETGVAIIVPSNHLDHRYLNVVGCQLDLTLELPDRPVRMQVTTRWCKRLSGEETEPYLLRLLITNMRDEDWVAQVRYVHASS
ncbi:MAG: PilZ domain-containing protein [Pyrinomonadaceae bacterium]